MIKTTIVGYGEDVTNIAMCKSNSTLMDCLEKYLPQYYPAISWNIQNEASTNTTTSECVSQLNGLVLTHHPNIVCLTFGMNDSCMQPKLFHTLIEFENNIRTIIKRIKSHNNRTGLNGCIPIPILITPPPVNEAVTTPMRSNNRLKQYIYIIKKVAIEMNCPLVNCFEEMKKTKDYISMLEGNGYLLNEKGVDFLYDLLFLELTKLINYEGVIKDRDIIDIEKHI